MHFSLSLASLFLQREGAEDILDFWLDVQQHENLCRAYFKDVRKSGRTIKEDWPQYWDYARRRGSIYGTVVGLQPNGGGTKRSTASTSEMLNDYEKRAEGGRSTSPRPPTGDKDRIASPNSAYEQPRSTTPFSLSGRTPTLFNMKRASRAPTVIPRSSAITRMDLIASAERIFFRYLSPAGNTVNSTENHEIYLPPSLRIHNFPLSSAQEPKSQSELALMAQIPDYFHTQKEYCFRAMEQDAFPRFLRSKAFGNLTPMSALVRLIAGLIVLWIGLAVGFSLIFLDVQPKSKRFFVCCFFLASCRASSDLVLLALHTLYRCATAAHLASVRVGPHLGVPRPIGNHSVSHIAHTRAVRQETPPRTRHMGYRPRHGLCRRADAALLGGSRSSTLKKSRLVCYLVFISSGYLPNLPQTSFHWPFLF